MMTSGFRASFVIATLIAASLGRSRDPASAQTPEVIFQGKVTDQDRAPIEGVQIIIKNEETGAVHFLATSSAGKCFTYSFGDG